jgi:Aromatic-ring-opening dioxygenase LigAB, LigA subunit
MSVYEVSKIFYRLDLEPELLHKLKSDPAEAIKDFKLTPEERRAVLEGDIGALYRMGVHSFLLASTVRHGLFDITREVYERRIREQTPTSVG